MIALITKENNPKVTKVMGKDITCNIGLTVQFNSTSTKLAKMAVPRVSTLNILGITRAMARKSNVCIAVLISNFIYLTCSAP